MTAACLGMAMFGCASPREDRSSSPDAAAFETPELEVFARLKTKYDRNGDGRITRDEHDRGPVAFKNLDRDGDGAVTEADFRRPADMPPELAAPFLLVRLLSGEGAESVAPSRVDDVFETLDESGDGLLTADDVKEFFPADRFRTLLAVVDSNRDAALTSDELRSYIAARDRDGDGKLSLRERETRGREPAVGYFAPNEREPAAPFTLKPRAGGAPVSLASHRGRKPAALIFGSFT